MTDEECTAYILEIAERMNQSAIAATASVEPGVRATAICTALIGLLILMLKLSG
jgi:hypothetical protein